MPAIGQTFSHYRVVKMLGSGGMGEVYQAADLKLGRDVALKVLPEEFAHDADRVARFQREAKLLASLNHPNIAAIHGLEESGGTSFLVLELVEGETLSDRLRRGLIPIQEYLKLALQIAEALEAAHEKGIIHRDLKPGNIMVTPEKRVKVLDCGLAKLSSAMEPEDETRTAALGTTPGMVMGTVAYMSPEQTRGETLDGRSDIFSLGSVLYNAATGHLPFQGPSTLAIMHEIAVGKPPAATSLRGDLPRELDAILQRAMAKDKQDRYASAAEMVEALQALRTQPATVVSSAAFQTRPAKPWRLLAALALLATGVLGYYLWRTQTQIDSIAVLPFTNAARDPSLDNQADGLTEELINSLAQFPELKVKGRATVFRYRGKDLDPEAAGKELDVRAVLMGRVIRNGDRVSVQTDLVDTRDGTQLWGKQFNGTLAELQTIPDEITQQVADKIQLHRSDQKRLTKRHTANPQAYDLYLQGRRALGEMTVDRIRQSLVYFQQAIARDSNYAEAYAGLADSYSYLTVFEAEDPREAMPKAKEAALKALELDSETAAAYTSLGIVQSLYEWDWAGSRKRFLRALELDPSGEFEQHWYGHYLEFLGDFQGAQNQLAKCLAKDPLSPIYGEDLGYDLMMNRRYDEAIEKLRKVVELDPQDPIAHSFLALALEAKGLRDESLTETESARQYSGGVNIQTGSIGGSYCRLGRPEAARKLLADIQAPTKQRYVSPLHPAMIHIALGETDEGFRLLDRAVEERSVNLQYEGTDPVFNSVRRDPRFLRLRQKLGLPEAAWATGAFGK